MLNNAYFSRMPKVCVLFSVFIAEAEAIDPQLTLGLKDINCLLLPRFLCFGIFNLFSDFLF